MDAQEQKRRSQQAQQQFQESVEHISEEDVQDAYASGTRKVEALEEKQVPGVLASIWDDIKTLLAMLRDYIKGSYRQVMFGSIAAIAGAVLYFVSPVDVIPDFIPGLGYIDDASVLGLCLRWVRQDLERYRQWRQQQEEAPEPINEQAPQGFGD